MLTQSDQIILLGIYLKEVIGNVKIYTQIFHHRLVYTKKNWI